MPFFSPKVLFFSSPSNFSTLIAIKVSKYGPARTIYVRITGEDLWKNELHNYIRCLSDFEKAAGLQFFSIRWLRHLSLLDHRPSMSWQSTGNTFILFVLFSTSDIFQFNTAIGIRDNSTVKDIKRVYLFFSELWKNAWGFFIGAFTHF